jgi:hypothetical protein
MSGQAVETAFDTTGHSCCCTQHHNFGSLGAFIPGSLQLLFMLCRQLTALEGHRHAAATPQ